MNIKTNVVIFDQDSRLMFGQVREDALVDMFLVEQLVEPKHVFVIASGGCTALSLLSIGGLRVDAVDISAAQVALVSLKQAMFKHLGFESAKQACFGDARDQYRQVRHLLSDELRQNLHQRSSSFMFGLNNLGWVDERMRILSRLFYAFVHTHGLTGEFLTLEDPAQQLSFYQKRWCNWQWKAGLKIAFSKNFLALTHGKQASPLVPANFSEIIRCARPNALICVRAIFPRVNPQFGDPLVLDRELSDQAEKRDRSLFCNFYEVYRRPANC